MKPIYKTFIFLCMFLTCSYANAQFQGQVYVPDTAVKVYGYGGVEKTLAWCGGFDMPQLTMGDLNQDGVQDLVVFERGKGVRTFINKGSAKNPDYRYAPKYELNFPPIQGYLILADYNCDGIVDLFKSSSQQPGFDVWTGYYNSKKELCFRHYKLLHFHNELPDTTLHYPGYVNGNDIPAIVDIDGDGDLDFVAFDGLLGNYLTLYKNMQKEHHLPCDSIDIEWWTSCWGKLYQPTVLTYQFNMCNYVIENELLHYKVAHTGNCISILDYDGDGDMDILDGSVGFSNVVYAQNGRIPYGAVRDSMVWQDTTWQTGGHVAYMPQWPAIFNIDYDQDGKKDIIIAPNAVGENYHNILYYRDTSTTTVPKFAFQSDTLLIDKTIDVGSMARPMFYDYDKDGKPDLFIGCNDLGYYQTATGTNIGKVAYYRNTSTPGNKSFTLVTNDFMGLSTYKYTGVSLAVGDLDNDGKDDLVIGHGDGTLSFFKNTASSNTVQPVWVLSVATMKTSSGSTINVNGNAAPFVYDLNKDGKPDLISGSNDGYLHYYRNTSTISGTLSLQKINAKLGGVQIDSIGSGMYSVPFIGKMDNTHTNYMVIGSKSGLLYRVSGFQGGNDSSFYTFIDTAYSYIDTSYLSLYNNKYSYPLGTYDGQASAPAFADIDGDGHMEMVVGYSYGGVKIFTQPDSLPDTGVLVHQIKSTNTPVRLFPNPSKTGFTLQWEDGFDGILHITLVNAVGQVVAETNVPGQQHATQISTGELPNGMYYCILRSENDKQVLPVTVLK